MIGIFCRIWAFYIVLCKTRQICWRTITVLLLLLLFLFFSSYRYILFLTSLLKLHLSFRVSVISSWPLIKRRPRLGATLFNETFKYAPPTNKHGTFLNKIVRLIEACKTYCISICFTVKCRNTFHSTFLFSWLNLS